MGFAGLWATVLGAALVSAESGARACESPDPPTEAAGWLASAEGLSHLAYGELEAAVRCLRAARRGLPHSEVVARDLAVALARSGDAAGALSVLEEARLLGDVGGAVAEALIRATVGDTDGAIEAARRAEGVEGLTLAAALDDPAATLTLGLGIDQIGAEAGLARLVLARAAARAGAPGVAAAVAKEAERQADLTSDPGVLNTARVFARRARRAAGLGLTASVRWTAEVIDNPAFLTSGSEVALATRVEAGLGLTLPLGSTLLAGRVVLDHRHFLTDRETYRRVERTGLVGEISLRVPLSRDLQSALLLFQLKGVGLRVDTLSEGLGSGIEGGPLLRISLGPRWWGELGVTGVWTDYGEVELRNFDRDRIGQRAFVGLTYERQRYDVRAVVQLVHDEARGQVFDAIGIGVGTTGRFQITRWLETRGELGFLLRRFGPVGDEGVVGDPARRQELRWTASLELRAQVSELAAAVAMGQFLTAESEAGSMLSYSQTRASLGVELTLP